MSKEMQEQALEAIELARASGKIKKGANEVTKALERGNAKLVAFAKDTSPKEIVMHLPLLAKEKKVPCVEIDTKQDLGTAAGLAVPTTAVVVTEEGEAKKVIEAMRE